MYLENLHETTFRTLKEELLTLTTEENVIYLLSHFSSKESFLKSITNLAPWFYDCMHEKTVQLNSKTFELLATTNLQAWFSYTMYDHIRDLKIETGKLNMVLSIANLYLQKSFEDFLGVYAGTGDLFAMMDMSYLQNDPDPSFSSLVESLHKKSIATALVALIMLHLQAIPMDSPEYLHTYNFFRHYIIAQQLADDRDDIEIDLRAKLQTPVTFLYNRNFPMSKLQSMIETEIQKHMRLAMENLKQIPNFDWERFTELYIKNPVPSSKKEV